MERLSNEVEQFLQSLNNADHEGDADQNDTEEVVDVYFIPRQKIEPQGDIVGDVVDAVPAQSIQGPSAVFTIATIFFCVGILFSAIALQIFLAVNPPTATITLIPSVHTITVSATMPLGRLIHPITLSQSQTTPTTRN